MADVLQGRLDFDRETMKGVKSTDERDMWHGIQRMKQSLTVDDEYFHTDRVAQQTEFIFSDTLDGLLKFGERVFSSTDSYAIINTNAKTQVKAISTSCQNCVLDWWISYTEEARPMKEEAPPEEVKKESMLEEFLESR